MTVLSPARPVGDPAAVRGGVLARVEARISTFLDAECGRWAAIDPRAAVPVKAISDLVAAGGKRLRPAFCVSGYLAAGGDPADESIVDAAAGLEYLHACALIHDDIMDNSALRRGRPTVHVVHEAEHRRGNWRGEHRRYGESVALLAGDLALVYADRMMATCPPAVQAIWAELRTELIVGQFLDTAVAAQPGVDLDLCRWIALGKSGRYSVERPLALGAVLAGAPRLVDALSPYGLAVGEAFQLRDDLIDAFGDCAATGKPHGLDATQHKMTLLLATALERNGCARAGNDDTADPQAMRRFLDETGARGQLEAHIDGLVERARRALAAADIDERWRTELSAMAAAVAYRER
jgi:geranylgeranyl diphosphate synthase, type I